MKHAELPLPARMALLDSEVIGWAEFWRLFAETAPRAIVGYDGPVAIGSWTKIVASAGSDYGAPWIAVLDLHDHRVAFVSAHVECTTGNGSDAWDEVRYDVQVAGDLLDLVRLAMAEEDRRRLRRESHLVDDAVAAFRAAVSQLKGEAS